ncbi:MAG: hypothetical protein WBO24_18260 [Nitrospirales bacterium]
MKERLEYAEYFFTTAAKPFEDIISAIEKEEAPYVPVYAESGDPQFLKEWTDASTGLESVGITALSMLASSLQLFLNEWICRIEKPGKKYKRTHKKRGWFYAYQKILEEVGLNLLDCPADLELIEQAVLARNRGQHPDHLTTLRTTHSKNDLKKYPSPYFVSETDRRIINFDDGEMSWWLTPYIFVDHEKFKHVKSEIEKMCMWLEK